MTQRSLANIVVIVAAGLLLSACGGGSGTGAFGGGGGTDGGGSPLDPSISLILVREDSDGNEVEVDRVDPSRPATVIATIRNVDDDVIVNFSTTLGQFDPASASVLARNGEARITLEAGQVAGAGQVTATISVDNETIQSDPLAFEVLEFQEVEEDLQLGICTGGTDELDCTSAGTTFVSGQLVTTLDIVENEPLDGIAAEGTADISFVVVDAATTPVTPQSGVNVTVTSRCTNLEQASIASGQSGPNGVVTVTYNAGEGCEDTDNITATLPSTGATATGSIFVYPPRVQSINFARVEDAEGAEISSIFIKGSGGRSTARVIFQVTDEFGNPKDGQDVRFSLTTTIGELALQNGSSLSNDNGEVTAFVNAGFIATTVRVAATIDIDSNNDGGIDSTQTALSDALSVNTGVADQNSMSISATVLNVEGEDVDGTETSINIRLSDLFNNPVRDGTTVQFRTEYGSIEPTCNTSAGACSVTWTSQEPRRPLDPNVELGGVQSCPEPLIHEEEVTISGTDGDTGYLSAGIGRVETEGDTELVFETDYTVDTDGSGITCEADSALCTDGTTLKITYLRAWLDEDPPAGDTEHTISEPGRATAPFTQPFWGRGVRPCIASGGLFVASPRAPTPEAPAYLGSSGQIYGGRSTILAFAQGEESFDDENGNGIYDEGEPFIDLPEAFLDVNEDGVFGNGDPTLDDSSDNDPDNWNCYGPASPLSENNPPLNRCFQVGGDEDLLIDFNQNGRFDGGNGIYNGTACPETSDYCTRELVNIRRDIVILSAGSFANIAFRDGATGEYIVEINVASGGPSAGELTASSAVLTNDGGTVPAGVPFEIGFGDDQVRPGIGQFVNLTGYSTFVLVDIADQFNGRLPQGTTVSFDAGGVCEFTSGTTSDFGSSSAVGPRVVTLGLQAAANPPSLSADLTASTEVQSGTDAFSSNFITCSVSNN